MRCSCRECGTYMIQAESDLLGCVCPDCGYRCTDCLGTDTVVSRDRLKNWPSISGLIRRIWLPPLSRTKTKNGSMTERRGSESGLWPALHGFTAML